MSPRCVAVAALAVLAIAGCGSDSGDEALPPLPERTVEAQATASPTSKARPARRARPVSAPVRVQIPAIGVDAPLIRLGLDAKGALEVPKRFDEAGWWTGGSKPGERGPAVIAGHVDSKTGPAVFYGIPRLRRGDVVTVRRRDGSSVRFTVQGSARYAKDRFPTARVYGPTRRPTLRLITCSGVFDRSSGHYLDNTVVFASA
jgi:sortase (surface protein transpeptidase)